MTEAISVTITGTQELAAKFAKLSEAMASQHLANVTMAGALIIEAAAKEKAPVRTGNLRRSIHSAIEESSATSATARVGTNVFYAPFLEFGTRFMSARPYLRPALDEKKDEAQRTIRESLKILIEQASR